MPQVLATIEDLAGSGGDQPEEEAHQRRLAAPALADDGGHRRCRAADREREIFQRDGFRLVDETRTENLAYTLRFEQRGHDASYRWQAARWPGWISRRGGIATLQRSMTYGQRGWKGQPAGGLSSEGGEPAIAWRSSLPSSDGRLAISSWVYGWSGLRKR